MQPHPLKLFPPREATLMNARCTACGAEVLEEAAYCSQCGQALPARPPTMAEAAAADTAGQLGPPTVTPAPSLPVLGRRTAAWPLQPDEEKLWEGGYSGKAILGGWLLAALVTVVTTVVAISVLELHQGLFLGLLCAALCLGGIGLYVMFRKLCVHYTLTSQRFIHRVGLLRCVTDRLEMIDVDDVAFSQGPIQRLTGVGTIKIMSSDCSHPELFLNGIDRVAHVAGLIDEARRAERIRRGLFIDA